MELTLSVFIERENMKKISYNIFLIVIASIIILFSIKTNVYAISFNDIWEQLSNYIEDTNSLQTDEKTEAGDIFTGADEFIQAGVNDNHTTIDDSALEEMSDSIYNLLLIIAIVVAVIVGLVIGIQFMTGSVAQKAKIKETLIPYIAGCIVIFGAFGIWKLVVEILSQA